MDRNQESASNRTFTQINFESEWNEEDCSCLVCRKVGVGPIKKGREKKN